MRVSFLSLTRSPANYESLLFGSFLGITRGQVLALTGVAACALVAVATPGAAAIVRLAR